MIASKVVNGNPRGPIELDQGNIYQGIGRGCCQTMQKSIDLSFRGAYLRSYLRLEDFFRRNNFAVIRSIWKVFLSGLARNRMNQLEALILCLVNQNSPKIRKRLIPYILRQLQKNEGLLSFKNIHDRQTLRRSIILKNKASSKERGALLVLFESELLKLLISDNFRQIEEEYQILFLPSWQPIYSLPLFLLGNKSTKDYFIMPSIIQDTSFCSEMNHRCITLPFHAASWVSERFYHKSPPTKDIDIIMVANFNKYKRHWRLFEAVRQLPKSLNIVIAGIPIANRTKSSVLNEAKAFGVENRIKVVENLSDDLLAEMISRAKIMLALSHKEGPFISVAEALMANTPVGMYQNAIIGSKAYINDQTGVLFDPRMPLAPQVMDFLQRSACLTPSTWAKSNISAEKNVVRLNRILRDYADSRGYRWSRDLEPFFCRHFDFYYEEGSVREQEFRSTYREFRQLFGFTITRPQATDD